MANYKLHLEGSKKTKNKFNLPLPICGKISTGIEYDTISASDFKNVKFENRCKNCNKIFENN